MRRIFLAISLFICVTFSTQVHASRFSDWYESTWLGDTILGRALGGAASLTYHAVTGIVESLASGVACTIAPDSKICPTDCSFAERMLEYTQNSCWFCGVFSNAFDVMNDIVTQMCYGMHKTFLTLLGLGFLFWLAFRIGKVVIDITPDSGDAQLMPDIFKQTIRVSIAALMLIFYLDVFDFLISPALRMGIGVGNYISEQNMSQYVAVAARTQALAEGKGKFDPRSWGVVSEKLELCQDMYPEIESAMEAMDSGKVRGRATGNEKVFSNLEKQAFLCYIKTGSASMATGMAIGSTAIHAWGGMGLLDKLRHMQLPMIGLEIFVSFFALFLAFPLKLFDPLVNLTFVCAMFPLWVVLWAFEQGKEYVKNALGLFIGVIVHLIVISVMMVLVISIMGNALGNAEQRNKLYQDLLNCKPPKDIFEGIGSTDAGALIGGFGLVGKGSLMTVALGIFAFQLFKKTKDIAGKFEGIVDFGASDTAARVTGTGASLSGQAGSSLVSAGYHSVSGGRDLNTEARDKPSRLGTVGRTLGLLGGGGVLGAAVALRRFNKTPAPANHTGTGTIVDSFRTSKVGSALGNLFGGASWKKEKDSLGNEFRLDRKTGINTMTGRDGSFVKYDRKNQNYSEVDKDGKVRSSYDYRTGKVSVGDKAYQVTDRGAVIDMSTGAEVSDARVARDVTDVKQRAETNQTEFERRLARNRMV